MNKTLPVLALLLSGCAIDGAPRLTSLARQPSAAPITLVTYAPDAPEQTVRLAEATARELGGSAAPASAPQAAALLLSTSRAPASLGLAVEGKPGEPVRWLSQPRRKGRFDPCPAERLHAHLAGPGLTVFGEVDFCTLDKDRIDALARTLADAVRGG
ncbi:MAG TPA: hypothetical protein PKD92_03630 [Novosphingobium sp.]|nr:hypothetical protein [Novosphingobium sp.]HMP55645.1 hypothetical protein [Novosphingobium sp.]